MREDRLGMHVMAEKTGIAQRWVIADAVEFAVNRGGGIRMGRDYRRLGF